MSGAPNPEMLVIARESRSLSQVDLAAASGLTQAYISKAENGFLEVPDDKLSRIGNVLGYPVSFFTQSDRLYGYGSPCLYHRKRQSVPTHALRDLQARMNVVRMQIARLLQEVEIETQEGFHRLDVEEYGPPEKIAQIIRASWHIPLGPIKNLFRTVEAAGGVVARRAFGTRQVDAVSQWPPGQRPLFLINEDIPNDRCRFTLAHEIGHILMHAIPTEDQETEANRFAAELLMPAKEIRHDLDGLSLAKAAALKPFWRVSMAALIRRAYDLEKISQRQYQRLFTHLGQMGYRVTEPNPIEEEEPILIPDVIKFYQQHYGYRIAELSGKLNMLEAEFRTEYLRETPHRLRVVG